VNDTSPAISQGIGRKGDGMMFFVPPRDGFTPVVEKPRIRTLFPLDIIWGHCIFPCAIRSSLTDFSDKKCCCWHGQRKRCALASKTLQRFQWYGVFARKNELPKRANDSLLCCGIRKECFSESTIRPRYSKEVVGASTEFFIPIV